MGTSKRKRPARAAPDSGRNGDSPDPPELRRRRTPLFNVSLVVAVAILAFSVLFLAGYLFRNALFSNPLFPVTLHNDGAAAVDVRGCGTNCTSADVPYRLNPGGSVQVAAEDNGEVTFYLHDPTTGAVTGCLPLKFARKVTGVTIQTSQAETCPGVPLTP
ncbi:MAG TPA: hypothetical protein VHA57_00230 [Actinomycetota bacterium]|nr:hypothetical protein [Actinomycetota bacterium]